MPECGRRCHQNFKSFEYPPTVWDNESEHAMADRSQGTRWAMGHLLETQLSARIDVMRFMRLLRCLDMKCSCQRVLVALAIFAIENVLWS